MLIVDWDIHHGQGVQYCFEDDPRYVFPNGRVLNWLHTLHVVFWNIKFCTLHFFFSSVLYFSWHRYEHQKFWPHLRDSDYDIVGKEKGAGFNINVPWNKVSNHIITAHLKIRAVYVGSQWSKPPAFTEI